MSRRRSPTAPTTSLSAARFARPPTRAPRPRRSRRRLPLFSRSERFAQQPLEVRVDRKLHAVKQHLVAARHSDGGEILHLELADFIGLVLDVDPAEFRAGELLAEREEAGAVFDAGVAPLGAKAAH